MEIGLPGREVTDTVARWAHVGVERDWVEKETPEHRVELADFRIAMYPVTNAEYLTFLRDTGHPPGPPPGISAPTRTSGPTIPSPGSPRRTPTPTRPGWPAVPDCPGGCPPRPNGSTRRRARTGSNTLGRQLRPRGRQHPGDRRPHHHPGGRLSRGPLAVRRARHGRQRRGVRRRHLPSVPRRSVRARSPGGDDGEYRVARGGSFCRYGDLTRTRRRHGPFPGPLYPVGFRLALSTPPSPPAGTGPEEEGRMTRDLPGDLWKKLTSTVGLVVTRHDGTVNVMAAEWATFVNKQPLYTAVALGPRTASRRRLEAAGEFSVTLCAEGQAALADFAGSFSVTDIDKTGSDLVRLGTRRRRRPPGSPEGPGRRVPAARDGRPPVPHPLHRGGRRRAPAGRGAPAAGQARRHAHPALRSAAPTSSPPRS